MIVGSLHITCDWQQMFETMNFRARAGLAVNSIELRPIPTTLCMNIEHSFFFLYLYTLCFFRLYLKFFTSTILHCSLYAVVSTVRSSMAAPRVILRNNMYVATFFLVIDVSLSLSLFLFFFYFFFLSSSCLQLSRVRYIFYILFNFFLLVVVLLLVSFTPDPSE